MPDPNTKPGAIVSSTRVETAHGHDRVSVWSRGGLAGVLTVTRGDGDAIAERLDNDGSRLAEIAERHRDEVDTLHRTIARLRANLDSAERSADEARSKLVAGRLAFKREAARARAAGRRLGEYWRRQCEGQEAITSMLSDEWRRKFSNAIGRPLGSAWVPDALDGIRRLIRDRNAALDRLTTETHDAE